MAKTKEEKWEHWLATFAKVEKFTKETGEVPVTHHPEFGNFMHKQRVKYKKELNSEITIGNKTRHDLWKNYVDANKLSYYKHNEWLNILNDIQTFINANEALCKNLDSTSKWKNNKTAANNTINKYGRWIQDQNTLHEITKKLIVDNNYNNLVELSKNKEHLKLAGTMKHQEIYDAWAEFKQSPIYEKHFMNEDEKWFLNAKKLREYVAKHNKFPRDPATEKGHKSDESVIQLATWIASQKRRIKDDGTMRGDEWKQLLALDKK